MTEMNEKGPAGDAPAYTQQPQAVPAMAVTGNRNVKGVAVDADGTREWSNGLCSCCNEPGTCILAWCCPCIVYAQNKRRCEHLNSQGVPDPEHGGECTSSDCWLHCAITTCFGAGWILQFMQRGNVRVRYGIKGSTFGDCCTAWCCSPCELTQEYQELELEEKSFGNQGPILG